VLLVVEGEVVELGVAEDELQQRVG